MEKDKTGKGAGRPVDHALRAAIIAATGGLLRERGYDDVSVEAIAARAGATKQTIYRVWGSKAELVADAVAQGAYEIPAPEIPHTAALRDDLVTWMLRIGAMLRDPGMSALVRALAGVSRTPMGIERRVTLDAVLTLPVEQTLEARLSRTSEFDGIADPETMRSVVTLVIGYLTLVSISDEPMDEARLKTVVAILLDGIRRA